MSFLIRMDVSYCNSKWAYKNNNSTKRETSRPQVKTLLYLPLGKKVFDIVPDLTGHPVEIVETLYTWIVDMSIQFHNL